jgi:rhamnose utilization protein RhaD (predicted bifunctional aldolase and dehydrogenase)
VDFDPNEGAHELKARLREGASYRENTRVLLAQHERARGRGDVRTPTESLIVSGVGSSAARNAKEAGLSRDFATGPSTVMRGASALGGYISLTEEET